MSFNRHSLFPRIVIAALLVAISAAGLTVSGQTTERKSSKDKNKSSKTRLGVPSPPLPPMPPRPLRAVAAPSAFTAPNLLEKAVLVRPDVYVSLCVKRGAVRVNGWDREEVRVFSRGGEDLGLKVRERDKRKTPNWVEVLGATADRLGPDSDRCVTGEMIELDVPNGASVTIKGLSSETAVDGIKRAAIEIVGGDIYLNDITHRIEASTQQGGVTVNNSKGSVAVATTTGNIVAYNTEAIEAGDYFKAKTRSGSVTLQSIGQKEIAASTISGSINYLGDIKEYGRYQFTTTNGFLNIVLPEQACFLLTAAYGGRFLSDFPVKLIREEQHESSFFVQGMVCKSEATLTLKSFSGTIRLRKKEFKKPTVVVVP